MTADTNHIAQCCTNTWIRIVIIVIYTIEHNYSHVDDCPALGLMLLFPCFSSSIAIYRCYLHSNSQKSVRRYGVSALRALQPVNWSIAATRATNSVDYNRPVYVTLWCVTKHQKFENVESYETYHQLRCDWPIPRLADTAQQRLQYGDKSVTISHQPKVVN